MTTPTPTLTDALEGASQAFVASTLATLCALLVLFGLAAFVLWRRFTHPEPHRKLLMEMEEESDPETQPAKGGKVPEDTGPKPWEREADWWKK